MMNNELLAIVNYIERERGVEREIVLVAIEQAIQQAARKNPNVTNDLRVAIDRQNLSIHVYDTFVISDEDTGPGFISIARAKRYVANPQEGDTIEVELPASRLGRIAAQTSRQMIMQKIREAEKNNAFNDFKGRVNEIISGTVSAVVRRDLYVIVGKTEMYLPSKERIPGEEFQVGDSIRAIVKNVDSEANGPNVTLSRSSPEFLRALFRLEVSEIADGIVEVMSVSRDPGYRAKIAVRTHDEKIDPVGACVGLKGARVKNIVRELNGEKVDIVRWNEDITKYVAQALAPAKLESVEVDPYVGNLVKVVVSPDQYTLAIGKRGQNVRLASKLTGWRVEVTKAIVSFEDQRAEQIRNLSDTFSISTAIATQMFEAGFNSVEGIVEVDERSFIEATGIDEITAKGLYAAALAVANYSETEETEEA